MVDERKVPEGWVVKKLKDLSTMKSGNSITSKKINDYDKIPCYGGNGLRGYTYDYTHEGEYALIGRQGALCGNVQFVSGVFFASEHAIVVTPNDETDIKWLFYMLTDMGLNKYSESSAQPGLSVIKILNLELVAPADRIEQKFIAEALSDTDNLIQSLENLINKKKKIKQGAMQQLMTGKKRLPGFSGEWDSKGFSDVFVKKSTKNFQIASNEYLVSGHYPVVDQGKKKIVAFYDKQEKVFNVDIDGVIIFGDHTRLFKYIDFDFVIGADGTQILTVNSNNDTKFQYYQLVSKEIPNTGYNRHFKYLKEFVYFVPPIEEQKAIAQVLSDMDAEIEALEEKLEKYKTIKQGMMQELLTGRIRLI